MEAADNHGVWRLGVWKVAVAGRSVFVCMGGCVLAARKGRVASWWQCRGACMCADPLARAAVGAVCMVGGMLHGRLYCGECLPAAGMCLACPGRAARVTARVCMQRIALVEASQQGHEDITRSLGLGAGMGMGASRHVDIGEIDVGHVF